MATFDELVASRKEWIDAVLAPWCRSAARRELLMAEAEWNDIAGRVDPNASLWSWAWSRFPDLVDAEVAGINETREVRVRRQDGSEFTGFPNARESTHGRLVLTDHEGDCEPVSIDEIAAVFAVGPT